VTKHLILPPDPPSDFVNKTDAATSIQFRKSQQCTLFENRPRSPRVRNRCGRVAGIRSRTDTLIIHARPTELRIYRYTRRTYYYSTRRRGTKTKVCRVSSEKTRRARGVKSDRFIGTLEKPLRFANEYCYEYCTEFTY